MIGRLLVLGVLAYAANKAYRQRQLRTQDGPPMPGAEPRSAGRGTLDPAAAPATLEVATSAPALHWTVVGDPADHERTDEVLQRLQAVRERHPETGHGDRMVVVLEAPDAEPVIEIVTLGLDVFTEVITELRLLRLRDRLEGQDQASASVQAAFS